MEPFEINVDELSTLRELLRWRCAVKEPPKEEGRYLVLRFDGRVSIFHWSPIGKWFIPHHMVCKWLPIPPHEWRK